MKHGKPYLHEPKPGVIGVRFKGRFTTIKAAPGTAEFDRQYWEIRNGTSAPGRTSWANLIESYRKSERWVRLKVRTRKDYERVLLYLADKIGHHDVRRLERKHVISAQKKNAERVRFANYIPQVMSVLCEHAINIGWLKHNPARGVDRLPVPKAKKKPHTPWPDWAVERWRAEARPLPRLIFEIGLGSVQRPGDWPTFRWNNYDGEALDVTQGKTDKSLWLPCTDMMKAALDSAPRKGLTIITREDGQPSDYDHMAKVMLAERKRLDLEAYDLHALRYRGVMELAWAGCDDDEIMAYSGHETKAMVRKYAGIARQRMRAQQAKEKRR